MKLAAVDVGTNSCRLLIGQKNYGAYDILERKLITTRLGEKVDEHGYLEQGAADRTIAALQEFTTLIRQNNVDRVMMVGTSALRDVNNSEEFLERVVDEVGYQIKVVTGREEARLIYQGVSTDLKDMNFLIVDIGGGSTEFIWGNNNDISVESINIGAVRLTERYIDDPTQPLSTSSEQDIIKKVKKDLKKIPLKKLKAYKLIGVGGTITTLGAMDLKLTKYDSNMIHHYMLKKNKITSIKNKLKSIELKERKSLCGLQPERADIITGGVIILNEIMNNINCESLVISERDILFGILEEIS